MQQCLPASNIPTMPAIVMVSQVQALPVVCQPQVSQVVMQQPLNLATQPQFPIGGTTQTQTVTITPHLGQTLVSGNNTWRHNHGWCNTNNHNSNKYTKDLSNKSLQIVGNHIFKAVKTNHSTMVMPTNLTKVTSIKCIMLV